MSSGSTPRDVWSASAPGKTVPPANASAPRGALLSHWAISPVVTVSATASRNPRSTSRAASTSPMTSWSTPNTYSPIRSRRAASTGATSASASARLSALTVMRTSVWPGWAAVPTVGLVSCIRSPMRASMALSPMPQVRRTRLLMMPRRPKRPLRKGSTSASIRCFISWGTPGRLMSTCPSCSTKKAGAVPTGLWITVAPRGRVACLRLLSVMV